MIPGNIDRGMQSDLRTRARRILALKRKGLTSREVGLIIGVSASRIRALLTALQRAKPGSLYFDLEDGR